MRNSRREDGPTPAGGAYSITTWDEESGNAGILEYDSSDHVICRREWELFATGAPGPDGVIGELRTFDPSGRKIGARPIRG